MRDPDWLDAVPTGPPHLDRLDPLGQPMQRADRTQADRRVGGLDARGEFEP